MREKTEKKQRRKKKEEKKCDKKNKGTQPNCNVMIFSQGETTPTLVPSPSSVRP